MKKRIIKLLKLILKAIKLAFTNPRKLYRKIRALRDNNAYYLFLIKLTILSELAHVLKLHERIFLSPLGKLNFKNNLVVNFVCTGNICRSPYAEYRFKALLQEHGIKSITAISSGTHTTNGHHADQHAISAAERRSLDISAHRSSALDLELINKSDLLIVLGSNNYFDIIQMLPAAKAKTIFLGALILDETSEISIADPYRKDDIVFNYVFQTVDYCLNKLLNQYVL